MKKIINITIISFILVINVAAQSPEEAINFLENESGIGIKAQAMGNAFVGVADDYSALYWNPAGLTQLDRSQISGSLYHLQFNNESTFSQSTMMDDRSFTKLKSLGMAYAFPTSQGSFVIAFGYNRFKDYDDFLYFSGFNGISNNLSFELEDDNGNYDWYDFDRNVQQTEQISQDGNLGAWSIGGGLALSPKFSIGLTLNFYSGSSQYLFDFYQDDVNDVYTSYPGDYYSYELHQKILSDLYGFGIKLGGLMHLNENLRLGMSIDFPTTLTITENYSANDVLTFDDGYISEYDLGEGEWEYVVQYPFKFSGGIALDIKQFMVAASFEFRDWSQVQFDIPEGISLNEDYNELLNENKYFAEDFRSTLSLAAGAEYQVTDTGIKLRGGYKYVPSPLVDADKKLNREYFSAGLGYEIDDNSTFNFSITKGFWKRNSVDSYTPGGTNEDIETTQFMAGVNFKL
jgi:long-subunit fatty acid transport protein